MGCFDFFWIGGWGNEKPLWFPRTREVVFHVRVVRDVRACEAVREYSWVLAPATGTCPPAILLRSYMLWSTSGTLLGHETSIKQLKISKMPGTLLGHFWDTSVHF